MNKKTITEIFNRFQQRNPHPTTELLYKTPFELLIAVILSARATDKSVNKATQKLFPLANTPEKMVNLGEEKLKQIIKTIGLYNTKAKNIIKTAMILRDKHPQIPHTEEGLRALPGVGRKTAQVVLNIAFGKPCVPVDTHVFRVSHRLGLVHTKTILATEKQLLKVIPQQFLSRAALWLVIHGRYVCIARKPKCSECFVRDLCEYAKNLF